MNMKKLSIILLTVAAACTLACSGSDAKYEVSGKNAPKDGVTVYLMDKLSDAPIDSAIVADGAFTMKGKAAKDAFLLLQIDDWDWGFPLFNDGKPVRIDLADSTYVAASELNMKLNECDRRDGAAYKVFNDFIKDYLALPKEEQEARESAFIAEYQERLEDYGKTYVSMIEENMDNLIPVVYLQNLPLLADKDKFDEIMASGAPFTEHPYAQHIKRQMDEAYAQEQEAEEGKNAVIGKKFQELEEADTNGKMHKLSEYVGQGNWVLVDFWASWCGPCKAEMPNVVEAYKKYHGKGFEIVGISFDKEKEPWVKAITDWEMPWIHLSDLKYWNNAAVEVYSVNAIPDNLLIDPKGIIVARGLRGQKLADKLAEIYE